MENQMEILSVITMVVSVVMLIVFFMMASNIADMKKYLFKMCLNQVRERMGIKYGEGWKCPNCEAENKKGTYVCSSCKRSLI